MELFINNCESQCRICLQNNGFFEWTEPIFELYGPSYKECYYKYTSLQETDKDKFTTMICMECGDGIRNTSQLIQKALASDMKLREQKTEIPTLMSSQEIKKSFKTNTSGLLNQFENSDQVLFSSTQKADPISNEDTTINEYVINRPSRNRQKLKIRDLMCAYCSKTFYTRNHLDHHEKTHNNNRERKEVCPHCGLKFYCKMILKNHMVVHNENRERKFKCEFCIKAFVSRGGLNIHKRKHLGQMLKCKLCPKEYYRQCDLNLHMKSHNVTFITKNNANVENTLKDNEKYFMVCKFCDRKITRKCWESHKAKHLNQPQVQCGICEKTYFSRNQICRHLRSFHKVSKDEYDNFIIKLNDSFKPRLSSLMKKQNIVLD